MSYPPLLKNFYDHLLESQYWPLERHRTEQRKYLTQLVLHAREHVPYYAGRLDGLLAADGQIDWDRWLELPTLSRADALAHTEAMLSGGLPPHHGVVRVSKTSGSTGPALSVAQTQLVRIYNSANRFRAQRWFKMDVSQDMLVWFGDNPEVSALPEGDIIGPWGPPWSDRATGKRYRVNRFTRPEDVLDFLTRKNIRYFSARPGAAHSAALTAERLGLDIVLDGIFTFNTGARQDERDDCARIFGGAPMIVPYSATEASFIAQQCPTGTHFHIHEETVFLEILNADNRPCAPGETGRVVVTPLYNYAQPFIRYELGDLASLGPRCACGRTLRVIERLAGRVTHMFRFPDGRQIALSMSTDDQAAFGARYWQIAQIEPLRIEVRYVPLGEGPGDSQLQHLTGVLRHKTHPNMQVQFSARADISRPDGRKFIEYVYEVAE